MLGLPGSSIVTFMGGTESRQLVQGIFDGELYKTSDEHGLLSRDDGDVSVLGRLQLWSALQISRGWQFYAMGELETDDSSGRRLQRYIKHKATCFLP